jgi:fumarate reductase flavoprotein subunit
VKQLEADVVVIAGGAAGLAAAVAAAERGAKVTVLEKGSTTGGTGNMGMGLLGVESNLQKSKLIGPTKDEAFKLFMDYIHWRGDAQLVRAYIDKSGDTINWLESMGVKFVDAATYFRGGNQTWHIVKPDTGVPGPMCAGTMYKILTGRAQQLGVRILLKSPATKIIKMNDRIAGVIAEDESGEQFEIKTKAAIVATGGFGDSPELIKKNTGYEWGKDMFSMRTPGTIGDGIRMAREVGAASTDMMMEMIYDMPEAIAHSIDPRLTPVFKQPHLLVNLLGKRFMNEDVMINTTFTGNAISSQKEKGSFLIFDEDIMKHMEQEGGLDHLNRVFPVTKVSNIGTILNYALTHGSKNVFIADSIEELAEKTGIDPKELRNTVDEYNVFCQKGHDDHFDKKYQYLRPIKTPKFYAGKLCCSAYGSLGGIKINYRTEVLDKNWKEIPGLYAAGVDACSIYGDSYPFILPGNTMGFSVNTGRISGENAADYAKSINQ